MSCATSRPGQGPGRAGFRRCYLVTCHFLALRVEISLVHDDLTRQTVPNPREEPLCRSKLCLNRDICVCAVLVGHGGLGRCYLVTCHFLALRAEISLVHDDLTRKTVPTHRQEPLCWGKPCLNRDICVCCPGRPRGGLGRFKFYQVTCHFLALLVEISLVHDDLTRQTVPKPREEPLCQSKLCLIRDICVCAVLVGHSTRTDSDCFQSVLVDFFDWFLKSRILNMLE